MSSRTQVWVIVIAILLTLIACVLNGQTVVKDGAYLSADDAVFTPGPDGVEVLATGVIEIKRVKIIQTDFENGIVVLNNRTTGRFSIAILAEGTAKIVDPGTYDVQVVKVENGVPVSTEDISGIVVGGEPEKPKDPIKDDPPSVDDPPESFQELAELTKRVIAQVNDPRNAKSYAEKILEVDFDGTIEEVSKRVRNVRIVMLTGVVDRPWRLFFEPVDEYFKNSEPITVAKYKAMWTTIAEAILEVSNESKPNQQRGPPIVQPWTPPVGVQIFEGMRWNGRIVVKQCFSNGTCRLVWVPE